MLQILKSNFDHEFSFEGIKIINTKNPTLFYKDIIKDSNIFIDNKKIKNEDVIYINNLSTFKEFINLNKKSFILTKILELINEYPIINNENILKIINSINQELNYEILDYNEGDIHKLSTLFVDLAEDTYLNNDILRIIFKHVFDSKKIIVLDNLFWLDIELLFEFINEHNFLIITNDFRKYIKNKKELELLVVHNDNGLIDILDADHLIQYLEKNTNIELDENLSLLKNESIVSSNLMFYILNI